MLLVEPGVAQSASPIPAPEPGTWIEYEQDGAVRRDLVVSATFRASRWWARLSTGGLAFEWDAQYILSVHRGSECLWRRNV